MLDNEYLLDMKIKNNVLYQRIMSECDTVKEFANKYNIRPNILHKLLNFKQVIYDNRKWSKGKIVPVITDLLKKLNCELSDIIPSDYEVKETNHFFKEIDAITMSQLSYQEEQSLLTDYTTEDLCIKNEMKERLTNILSTLTPREERVVRGYYYLGKTVAELGQELSISNQYVSFILKKAITKLRHPSRCKKLISYVNNPEIALDYAKDKKEFEHFTELYINVNDIDKLYKKYYPVNIDFDMFCKLIQNIAISKKKFAVYMLKHNIRGIPGSQRKKYLIIKNLFKQEKIKFNNQ